MLNENFINVLLGTIAHVSAERWQKRQYYSKIFSYWKNTQSAIPALRIFLVSASYKNKKWRFMWTEITNLFVFEESWGICETK